MKSKRPKPKWSRTIDDGFRDPATCPMDAVLKLALSDDRQEFQWAIALLRSMYNCGRTEAGVFLIGLLMTCGEKWEKRIAIQIKDCSLHRLHLYIQGVMGWWNYHLYRFEIGDVICGDPRLILEGFEDDPHVVESHRTRLSKVVPEDGSQYTFVYEYDFGDRWRHGILFEGCLRATPGVCYPICLEGERACPPEDVGGPWGYRKYLTTLADPEHEEWEETSEWRGPCRPEHFDAEAAAKAMRKGLGNRREMQ